MALAVRRSPAKAEALAKAGTLAPQGRGEGRAGLPFSTLSPQRSALSPSSFDAFSSNSPREREELCANHKTNGTEDQKILYNDGHPANRDYGAGFHNLKYKVIV